MESKQRTVIKATTYRALVTGILAMLSWTFTADAGQTTFITVLYAILATVGYYGHERIWNKFSWQTEAEVIAKSSASD